MKSIHKLLRERIHAQAGLPLHTLDELRQSQWSPLFETLMRNRLVLGGLRYGLLKEEGPRFDNVGSAIARLKRYQTDGNIEHLVDAANLCLVEFERGSHPKRHFYANDDGYHTKAK